MGYQEDRNWGDRFIPAIKRIVGPFLLQPSTLEQDTKEATDLIILNARDMRIAARVRRPNLYYRQNYRNDFTIRYLRRNGAETELAKIKKGLGDWFFYGHSNQDENDIDLWMILDLEIFRWNIKHRRNEIVYEKKDNEDGTTEFIAFDVTSFTPDILIGSSEPFGFEIPF